jgi:hypothetical protein
MTSSVLFLGRGCVGVCSSDLGASFCATHARIVIELSMQ